jgi:membrane dipeptidase
MGLVYSESNALGNGCKEDRDGGLTKFGERCVERMNKVGMLIDVSHCGPQTAYDAAVLSKKPIIASHVGAKGVWNTKRMADDRLIRAVAEGGGVIGIEAAPHTTMSRTNMTHDIDSFMEHFEYVVDLVGIDHVGFGVDCMYGDHVGLHHAFAAALSTGETSKTQQEYTEVPFVKYLENPTEASWNIPRWLVRHGYSDEDIAKVIGGNAIRVLREVWA